MKPGDVVWVDLPSIKGHAQSGRRPAIVVQNEAATMSLPTVLIVPLTTRQDALRFPGTVLIEHTPDNGLRRLSVALVFQMAALDKRYIDVPSGSVATYVLEAIWEAFQEITLPSDVVESL